MPWKMSEQHMVILALAEAIVQRRQFSSLVYRIPVQAVAA